MDEKIKVLFIDDDLFLGQIITTALQEKGYEVSYQNSLAGAKAALSELHPHILVLDVEIGTSNGIEATPQLKAIAPDIPILFVSSHTESDMAVKAIHAGAVNYLRKPFDVEELVAYIEHFAKPHNYLITIGTLTLNTETRELLDKNGKVIKTLSESEYKLLKLLAAYPNQTVNREQIEKEVWAESAPSEQSLNNFVSKLRKYLAEDPALTLSTMQKEGYKLEVSSE